MKPLVQSCTRSCEKAAESRLVEEHSYDSASDWVLQGKVGQQLPEVPDGVADQEAPSVGQLGPGGLRDGCQHRPGG